MRRKVLVVDDDPALRRLYDRVLIESFDSRFAGSAAEARRELQRGPADAVILDLGLPDGHGFKLIEEIRGSERLRALPVVVITGSSRLEDQVRALDAGADDYLQKPVPNEVLLARLRCALRHAAPAWLPSADVACAGLLYKPDSGALTVDGRAVHLHPKELGLLLAMLSRPNVIHSASYLWDKVWEKRSARWEHILSVTLSNLRRAVGPKWAERIETHKGRGYLVRATRA